MTETLQIGGVILAALFLGGLILLAIVGAVFWYFARALGKRSAFPEREELEEDAPSPPAAAKCSTGCNCETRGPQCVAAEIGGDDSKLVAIRVRNEAGNEATGRRLSRDQLQKLVDAHNRKIDQREENELFDDLAELTRDRNSPRAFENEVGDLEP